MPKKLKLDLDDLTVQSFVTTLDDETARALRAGEAYIIITGIPIPIRESILSCFHACMTDEFLTCECTRECG